MNALLRSVGIWILAMLGAALAVYFGLRLGTNEAEKQAIAAWVQAVGSLLGIAIAIYVPWRQRRLDSADRRKEELAREHMFHVEAITAGLDVDRYLDATGQDARSVQYRRSGFEVDEIEFSELLGRITWCRQRVDDNPTLDDLMNLRVALVVVTAVLRKHEAPTMTMDERDWELVDGWIGKARDAATALRERAIAYQLRQREAGK